MRTEIGNGVWYNADCFDAMSEIADNSVDMVLCDLPYGTTQNKWDSVIPFDQLWAAYEWVAKDSAAIVLTAAQPFTSALVMSNPAMFKYDWTWRKPKGTGHLNAKRQPMRDKEDVLVFYDKQCTYNPQMTDGTPYKDKAGKNHAGTSSMTDNYGAYTNFRNDNDGKRYPKQVIDFCVVERGGIHPTQKPVELFEYLIRTYTNPGDVVLDNTAGAGTTAIAAERAGRRWICIERDEEYSAKAIERINNHIQASS